MTEISFKPPNCPYPGCQKAVEEFTHEIKETLYGTGVPGNGIKGDLYELRQCVGRKLSTKGAIGAMAALLGLLTPFLLYMMSVASTSGQYAEQRLRAAEIQLTVVSGTVDAMNYQLELIRESIKELQAKHDMDIKEHLKGESNP